MKNPNAKFYPKISKEKKISMENNQIIKFNIIKNQLKVKSLCEIKNKIVSKTNFNSTNDNKNNTSNHKLNLIDLKDQAFFLCLSEEEREKLKEETISIINNLIKNEGCTYNLDDHISEIIEEKVAKVLDDLEYKFRENITKYSNELENTIYEERLFGYKIQKLTDYYENISEFSQELN